MSNQILISSGAKVRDLDGVLTGTSGIVSSVPLGGANGVATLDSGGKVPVSQLPASVVTYLGTWNAATNTPTLTNGTGDAGDMYLCNVAGTVDFGAGPITFAVGDWVLYGSGTWQKSNGQNGTVTSVAVTESGDALTITGSPITTSGTINIGFAGTSGQYVNGAGGLTTFPSLTGFVPYTGATAEVDLGFNNLSASHIVLDGYSYGDGGALNFKQFSSISVLGDGYTSIGASGTNLLSFNYSQGGFNSKSFKFDVTNITTSTSRTYLMPNANGTLALTSDLGAYLPLTGGTLTGGLIGTTGSFASSGSGNTFSIDHSSGSGIALNITKAGDGEGLYINKTSGSGNAATIVGTLNATTLVKDGGTSSQFLMADGSVNTSVLPSGAYLPLSGGTLTGALTGTSATFSDVVNLASTGNQTKLSWLGYNSAYTKITSDVGFDATYNGTYITNNTNAAGNAQGNTAIPSWGLELGGGDSFKIKRSAAGSFSFSTLFNIASTGAATFSSSVQATNMSIGIAPQTDKLFVYNASGTNTGLTIQQDGTGDIFRANGNSGANRFVVQQGGNVGIGTSSPSSLLHIYDSTSSSSKTYTKYSCIDGGDVRVGKAEGFNNNAIFGTWSNNDVQFYALGSERMRITSGGVVQIGSSATPALTSKLFISRSDQYGLHINVVSGTSSIIASDDNLVLGSSGSERMRITSNGDVLMGGTTNSYNSKLVVSNYGSYTIESRRPFTGSEGHIVFVNGNGAVGSIFTNGTSTSYNTSSDYRLKEDLKDFNGLDKVSAIKVYDFKWKTSNERTDGVLAHELAEILPYAVSGEKDGEMMQGVDYSKIVPILIKAIQEQQAQIEELKSLINK